MPEEQRPSQGQDWAAWPEASFKSPELHHVQGLLALPPWAPMGQGVTFRGCSWGWGRYTKASRTVGTLVILTHLCNSGPVEPRSVSMNVNQRMLQTLGNCWISSLCPLLCWRPRSSVLLPWRGRKPLAVLATPRTPHTGRCLPHLQW